MITLAVQWPSFSPGAGLGRLLGIKAIADWFSESYDQSAWPGRFISPFVLTAIVDSHRHLMIGEQEWDTFMNDSQPMLDKFAVPQQEQEE
jgi:hypothetical protein